MLTKTKVTASSLMLGLVMVWAVGPAQAMSVSPTHIELKSAGKASRAQVVVRNDSNRPLPVEATLKQLSLDENGQRRTKSGADSFLVFPPQTLIPPGASQVFRINWVGEPLLPKSESYMLTLAQIPVRMRRQKNLVQVVMAFGVVINVAPPRGEPQLRLENIRLRSASGGRKPVITVRNPTSVHALLPNSTIRLTGRGWSETLSPDVIGRQIGIGLVQPGKRRHFVLPVNVPSSVGEVRASLTFNPPRRQ